MYVKPFINKLSGRQANLNWIAGGIVSSKWVEKYESRNVYSLYVVFGLGRNSEEKANKRIGSYSTGYEAHRKIEQQQQQQQLQKVSLLISYVSDSM